MSSHDDRIADLISEIKDLKREVKDLKNEMKEMKEIVSGLAAIIKKRESQDKAKAARGSALPDPKLTYATFVNTGRKDGKMVTYANPISTLGKRMSNAEGKVAMFGFVKLWKDFSEPGKFNNKTKLDLIRELLTRDVSGKDDVEEWVKSFRSVFDDTMAWKRMTILYQHQQKIKSKYIEVNGKLCKGKNEEKLSESEFWKYLVQQGEEAGAVEGEGAPDERIDSLLAKKASGDKPKHDKADEMLYPPKKDDGGEQSDESEASGSASSEEEKPKIKSKSKSKSKSKHRHHKDASDGEDGAGPAEEEKSAEKSKKKTEDKSAEKSAEKPEEPVVTAAAE